MKRSPARPQSRPQSLSPAQIKSLAATAQTILFVGPCRSQRLDAVAAVHRAILGVEYDPARPHPDLSILNPECRIEPGAPRSIGIDAVKAFVDRMYLTPMSAPFRLGWIDPASALTVESQNALLSFTEEPCSSSRIVLTARRPEDLITTILSRCLTIRLPGRAGSDGESDALADEHSEEGENVQKLFDVLDNPESVERILEFKLAKQALSLFDSVSAGRRPEPKSVDAFLHKKPAGENTALFVETVFAGICERIRALVSAAASAKPEPRLHALEDLARRLLVLQAELRYNPSRPIVVAAVGQWLDEAER